LVLAPDKMSWGFPYGPQRHFSSIEDGPVFAYEISPNGFLLSLSPSLSQISKALYESTLVGFSIREFISTFFFRMVRLTESMWTRVEVGAIFVCPYL